MNHTTASKQGSITLRVNRRVVSSDTHDLDVYDTDTLRAAIMRCAKEINRWTDAGNPNKAVPYILFKRRIIDHLEDSAWR